MRVVPKSLGEKFVDVFVLPIVFASCAHHVVRGLLLDEMNIIC